MKYLITFLIVFISCIDNCIVGNVEIDVKYVENCFSKRYGYLKRNFKFNNNKYLKEIDNNLYIYYNKKLKLPYNNCDYRSHCINSFAGIDIPEKILGKDVFGFRDFLNGVECLFSSKGDKPFAIIIKGNNFCDYKMCTIQDKELLFKSLYITSLIYAGKEICEEQHLTLHKKKFIFINNCDSLSKEKHIQIDPYSTVITDFKFSPENNCLVQITFVNWDNFK